MKSVFVDTMGWFSLFDRRDAWHKAARDLMRRFRDDKVRLFTSDYIVDETATLLLMRGATTSLVTFFERIHASDALTVAMVGESRFDEAGNFFLKHRDQGYSFTDVTSFLLMRELRIREVLTHDDHFAKAGYKPLLV